MKEVDGEAAGVEGEADAVTCESELLEDFAEDVLDSLDELSVLAVALVTVVAGPLEFFEDEMELISARLDRVDVGIDVGEDELLLEVLEALLYLLEVLLVWLEALLVLLDVVAGLVRLLLDK